MSATLTDQIKSALAQFSSTTRLYELTLGAAGADFGAGGLLVEAFAADDQVQGVGGRDVIVLSTKAHIALAPLLGKSASVEVSLADGTRTRFTGTINEAAMLGSEGGLARYRLRLVPWMWCLSQSRNSRVWQDKSVIEIVDAVFEPYRPSAIWRWSDETVPFMEGAVPRSYCCQYRESDLDFVQRLLTEEGLCWRFEQTDAGLGAVLFADSTQLCAVPKDSSSKADGGIRYHNVRAGERQDTVQALRSQRTISVSLTTVLSYDYKSKRTVAASSPSRLQNGKRMPPLESFDVPGQYAYASVDQAMRYADLQMEGREARAQRWSGRSTLRTLRAGTRLTILGVPLEQLGAAPAFTVLRVTSVGVNNLPAPAQHALAELFGPIPELLQEIVRGNEPFEFALAIDQARKTGYANCFEAVRADVPWRAQMPGSDGRSRAHATAPGSQTAIVVGADGNDRANGADEMFCDRLGRVRIRFHWQDDNAGCWVRVAQRSAGGGMGTQFLPRIGTEVLVKFLEGNIDRPIIVGALYNGQGEGAIAPTPDGAVGKPSGASRFHPAHDQRSSAQGNLAGGNSPVWHGASADSAGHRNGAAQWGIRSKEFGGSGYNQLLFDDTDAQGRVQLKCSHAATELNLGHLIHSADNYRGSFRGSGIELRTDGYGAIRAGAGLLITSYTISHNAHSRDPAGDNAPAIAMLKQAVKMAETFSAAATTHQTVALAAHVGAAKANESALDAKAAPLKALLTAVSGMVSNAGVDAAKADASGKNTKPDDENLPQTTDAIIAIAAKAGLGVQAGQSLQMANGETFTLMSGQDTQFVAGGQMRVHSGQAIGILGGAVQAGEGNVGLQMIATKGSIEVQAQSDVLNIQARDEVTMSSANAHIDWAAAKRISLSTAGGANITIEGGNITVQCPGKLLIHAGKKSFAGPERQHFLLPVLPVSIIAPSKQYKLESTFAFDNLTAFAKSNTKAEFVLLIVTTFGFDVPAHTYIKLYEALRVGEIKNPEIVVMSGGHYPASFDNESRKILVHQAAADRAVRDNAEAWELAAALLHEFGHYIDAVLRLDLADKNADGSSTLMSDAPEDEGAKFAYWIAGLDLQGSSKTVFANYKSSNYSGPLRINYNEARKMIQQSQGRVAQMIEGKIGSLEYFPASPESPDKPNESFGHETIEQALRELGGIFDDAQVLKQIYFGNWLRDNSQLLDPKVVRNKDVPKDMTQYLSRAALTKIVGVMAKKKFGHSKKDRVTYAVTEDRLGVYRAVEHIDNPTSSAPAGSASTDPRTIDRDFEGPPTRAYVGVDQTTKMKRYIANSKQYMMSEIRKAAELGPTTDGFRHFGAGLHVLEDYFAHSNFIEVSLIKLGYAKVLPWTSYIHGTKIFPIVTGMFTSEDVVASTSGMIADELFKVQWKYEAYKPGVVLPSDEIALIILEEHSDQRLTKEQRRGQPTMLERYQWWMQTRDQINSIPGIDIPKIVAHYTIGAVANAHNAVINPMIHASGNGVSDAQVAAKGYPGHTGSTDPSHSQLAKDHDVHVLHVIAAQLSKTAVKSVGTLMLKRWEGDLTADPAAMAGSFLVHPLDCHWQDKSLAVWAKAHPTQLERLESATEYQHQVKIRERQFREDVTRQEKNRRETYNYWVKHYEAFFPPADKAKK
ncbi:MAG: type VI secretion system tip protein TssI/VgrG [Pseudomonadota bacterium]